MAVTTLSSTKMGKHNMQTHLQRLMCQDGSAIQDRLTKRGDGMDKESAGIIMDKYTLGDGRMAAGLKERCTSCKKMALTHSTMSSIKTDGKRQREKK